MIIFFIISPPFDAFFNNWAATVDPKWFAPLGFRFYVLSSRF
jgi:hypothetical protein